MIASSAPFHHHSTLTHLHLWWVGVSDNFFQPLQDERVLPNLKCLHLLFRFLGHPHLQLNHLVSRARQLESLSMASPQWSSAAIFPVLSNATNLKSLSVAGNLSVGQLTSINKILSAEPLTSLLQVITSSCRNMEYLKSNHLYLDPSSFALFYSLSRLTKLKQLSFNGNSSAITIDGIWSLSEKLGPSGKVKVYLCSASPASRERHRYWTTRDIQCDNLEIVLADRFQSLSVACIPPSSA